MPQAGRAGAGLLCAAAALLAACGTIARAPGTETKEETPGWQRVRFYIHWDRTDTPQWHVDALLAHRVAAPALNRERAAIVLWRFHRRAADDAVGHSLTLLSFAPPSVNARICEAVGNDPLVAQLKAARTLDRVECNPLPGERAQYVEATSDERWSAPLQRAWPHFIMGVSELWLRLIDEHAGRPDPQADAVPLGLTLERYRRANDAVTQVWQREGHHALLHHLNGLFGYEPLNIGPTEQRRF